MSDHAVIVRFPTSIPVPVQEGYAVARVQHKRDLGLSLLIASIVAASIAAVTTAAVALQGQVQTAAALVRVAQQTSEAFEAQLQVNSHLRGGLLIVNQRVDLIQTQVEEIWTALSAGCSRHLPGLCLTSTPYQNFSRAANLSRQLAAYLTGSWDSTFEKLLSELRLEVQFLNSTSVDLSVQDSLDSWFRRATRWFATWGGLGASSLLVFLALGLTFWCLCNMRRRQDGYMLLTQKAIMAVEAGADPQVWLAAMDDM